MPDLPSAVLLRRGVFTSVPRPGRAIADCLAEHDRDPKPFMRTADADAILQRLKRLCERTSDSEHESPARVDAKPYSGARGARCTPWTAPPRDDSNP